MWVSCGLVDLGPSCEQDDDGGTPINPFQHILLFSLTHTHSQTCIHAHTQSVGSPRTDSSPSAMTCVDPLND